MNCYTKCRHDWFIPLSKTNASSLEYKQTWLQFRLERQANMQT